MNQKITHQWRRRHHRRHVPGPHPLERLLGAKGICHELDPLVKTYPDETKFDDFFPSVIKDARGPGADGKLFVFPTIVHPGGNTIVMVNRDLITKPASRCRRAPTGRLRTWKSWRGARASPKDGIYGLQMMMNSPLYSTQITRGWSSTAGPRPRPDSWVLSPDGQEVAAGSAPVKASFEWTWKLVKDGFSPTSEDALPGSTGLDLFTAGKVVVQTATIGQPQADHDIIEDKFKWSALLWPKGPNGCRGTCLSYNSWAVREDGEPGRAYNLLNALTGTDAGSGPVQGHADPYARHSIWSSPDLWKKYPIDQAGSTVFEAGVDPFPMPANLRAQEYQDTFGQNIQVPGRQGGLGPDVPPRPTRRCRPSWTRASHRFRDDLTRVSPSRGHGKGDDRKYEVRLFSRRFRSKTGHVG